MTAPFDGVTATLRSDAAVERGLVKCGDLC